MKLSILIPVYNEEKTIRKVVSAVQKAKTPGFSKELVIVDDCSKDNSPKILKALKGKNIKVVFHKKNKGKGGAIRTALNNATGDILLIQDADLEYDPKDYPRLLAPFKDKKVSVVYGSRKQAIEKDIKNMYKLHYIGNMGLTFFTNIIYGCRITDMETGYKVFRKKVVKGMKLRARKFDLEPEITAKILKRGYKIKEVPISFVGRKFEEGKKITWRDGIVAVYYILKYRFVD